MKFELLPIIDLMLELYQTPLNADRFNEYLRLLQGNTKADMALPIAGFNPMAKDHLADKLKELKGLNAENITVKILNEINQKITGQKNEKTFQVAINVSDDLKGGWTNRYTSDYDSKFKFNGLFKRLFCSAIFWSGEDYSEELIKSRVAECVYRTIYWTYHPKPVTLKEHLQQEQFVAKHCSACVDNKIDLSYTEQFYIEHKDSDEYTIIFNFFYGDDAAASLQFPLYGNKGWIPGFEYAKQTCRKSI